MPTAWLSCTRRRNKHVPGRIDAAAKFWQLEGCGKTAEVVVPAEDAAAAAGLAGAGADHRLSVRRSQTTGGGNRQTSEADARTARPNVCPTRPRPPSHQQDQSFPACTP